jgi:DNA/RNA endonuclease YhcR with UshA esterase domain
MRRQLVVIVVGVFSLLASPRMQAHHSFTATYLEGRKVTIEGDVVQFQYRNPHSFLYVSVKNEKGEPQRWAIEWGGSGQLRGQNVSIDTVKPGDRVVVTGDASRTPGELKLRMRAITRPSDGWKWGDEID